MPIVDYNTPPFFLPLPPAGGAVPINVTAIVEGLGTDNASISFLVPGGANRAGTVTVAGIGVTGAGTGVAGPVAVPFAEAITENALATLVAAALDNLPVGTTTLDVAASTRAVDIAASNGDIINNTLTATIT